MMQTPAESEARSGLDHGCLPDWKVAELPEPLPFSVGNVLRTIGPGAILLAGSIGGGEWIVGPLTTVRFGPEILWIATLGIFLQMIFNLEAVRYTLYSGEPVMTGVMRLNPGGKFWGGIYVAAGTAQLATPAMAMACAGVMLTAGRGDLPSSDGSDRAIMIALSVLVLLATFVLLQSGKSIERMLEWLSWTMVVLIFTFLLVTNLMFVPADIWFSTALGFVKPSPLPANLDWTLIGVFAATAGSGGLGNLAVSNWTRDKGFGMAVHSGSIGGMLSEEGQDVSSIGQVFEITSDNLRKWAIWWKYVLIDQSVLWAIGCVAGMFLNVNLARAIVNPGEIPADSAAGAFQARYLADQLWSGFWWLTLINGFWIMFSTQVGNTDCLTRISTDTLRTGWPELGRLRARKLYFLILLGVMVWGAIALFLGDSAVDLFKILGLLASPILSVGAFQILRVNTRFLPVPLRPPLWRRVCLAGCGVFYGAFALISMVHYFGQRAAN